LIEIINKQLLLQLVGYLCYWQMGFNSVFKGLNVSLVLRVVLHTEQTTYTHIYLQITQHYIVKRPFKIASTKC